MQSTLFDYIQILGIKPDIMLIFVVSAAFINGEYQGAAYGVLCGILQDCLFAPFIGINIFLYGILGFFTGLICKNFYKENLFVTITAVFVVTLLFNFMCFVFYALLQGNTDILFFAKTIFLPAAIYNCILALPVYAIVYYFNEYLVTDRVYNKRMF